MSQPSAAYLLSRMAGLLVFAPAINADISMLNLIACIADETKRRRALAAAAATRTGNHPGSSDRPRPLLSPAQKAIVVGTCISIFGDLIILYTCVHSNLDNSWPGFPKWMAIFNIVKRLHSIIAVHITFLRFQVVTGRFKPKRSPRSRQRGASKRRTTLERMTSNMPALLSTIGYTVVSIVSVAFQLYAFIDNKWDGKASRESQPFALYRIISFVGTCYLTLIALYTDTALISLSTKLYEAGRASLSATMSLPLSRLSTSRMSSSRDAVSAILTPAISVENLTAAAATTTTTTTSTNATPFSIDPLKRVKKYYNHWINLAYEVILFFAYVILSVAYFFDATFIAGVFVEQALMAFVALNGYVLLHAALKEADAGNALKAGNFGAGGGRAKPRSDVEAPADGGFLFGAAPSSSRPFSASDAADDQTR